MKTLMILATALLAQPALAATPEQEALANELLVCAGKFGGLTFIGQMGGEAETRRFFEAANRIGGAGFVDRHAPAANRKAADWVFSKGEPQPTLDAARRSCLPLLAQAGQ